MLPCDDPVLYQADKYPKSKANDIRLHRHRYMCKDIISSVRSVDASLAHEIQKRSADLGYFTLVADYDQLSIRKLGFEHRRTPRSYCDTSESCLHSLCIMPSNQITVRRLEVFEPRDAGLRYSFPVQCCLVMITLDRLLRCKIMHVIRFVLVTSARRDPTAQAEYQTPGLTS